MARSQGFFTVVSSLANRWMRGQMLGPGYLDGDLPTADKVYEAQLALPNAGGLYVCQPKGSGFAWRKVVGVEDWGEFLISMVDQWPNFTIQNFSDLDPWQGPYILCRRSRGGSETDFTVVANGDLLGGLEFWGADGTNWAVGASIYAIVDGTPGNNDMPTAIVFNTSQDGSESNTERMRLKPNGSLILLTDFLIDAPSAWAPLGLDGATQGGTVDFYKNGNYQGSVYSETGNSIRIYDNAYGGDSLISSNGDITLPKYAGSGTRDVTVDSTGKLVAASRGLVLISNTSFSASSSVVVSNVFTSTYANYLVELEFSMSASNEFMDFYFRAGSTNSSTGHYWSTGYTTTATGTNQGFTNRVDWPVILNNGVGITNTDNIVSLIIRSPQLADNTLATGTFTTRCSTPKTVTGYVGCMMDNTTQYDGFNLVPNTGTITGTVRVYGLANS